MIIDATPPTSSDQSRMRRVRRLLNPRKSSRRRPASCMSMLKNFLFGLQGRTECGRSCRRPSCRAAPGPAGRQGRVFLVQVQEHVHVPQRRRQWHDAGQCHGGAPGPSPSARVYRARSMWSLSSIWKICSGRSTLFTMRAPHGVGLEHLPAGDESHAVRLEAVPALDPWPSRHSCEGHEADADEALGHLHEVGILLAQGRPRAAFAVDFALVGRQQGTL
jgi:hypothetical protein